MTDAINTNNRLKTANPATEQRTEARVKQPSGTTESRQASAVIELSSDQILKKMQDLPEVDTQRVESIKNALANGEYNPDPEVIARKFSEIEQLLP